MTNHDQLLAAVNPVPDPAMLESEAFSLDDVVDRLEQPRDFLVPATKLSAQRWRPAAAAIAALVLVAVAIAGGVVLTRGDNPALGGSSETAGEASTGDHYGSGSYNPFIGIRQSLVSQSTEPVFLATVDDYPAEKLYLQLLTLESFNGAHFYADQSRLQDPSVFPWVDPDHASSGPTVRSSVDIAIARLRIDWLPTPATPVGFSSPDIPLEGIQVRSVDGAVHLVGDITDSDMRYKLEVDIPEFDVNALIADVGGELTPLFARVETSGELAGISAEPGAIRSGPPAPDVYLDLSRVGKLADIRELTESVTADAGSVLEHALYLEAWFHGDAFGYSLDVKPGNEATKIATWLLDPESPHFHVGYAEQFATAFAVMARSIDIHSRVVLGFTPGEPNPDQGGLVIVRDRNAHAWVELWIPQQGWLRFDPTPRPDEINTPTFAELGNQLGVDLLPYLAD